MPSQFTIRLLTSQIRALKIATSHHGSQNHTTAYLSKPRTHETQQSDMGTFRTKKIDTRGAQSSGHKHKDTLRAGIQGDNTNYPRHIITEGRQSDSDGSIMLTTWTQSRWMLFIELWISQKELRKRTPGSGGNTKRRPRERKVTPIWVEFGWRKVSRAA